jgi:hypothetical protein
VYEGEIKVDGRGQSRRSRTKSRVEVEVEVKVEVKVSRIMRDGDEGEKEMAMRWGGGENARLQDWESETIVIVPSVSKGGRECCARMTRLDISRGGFATAVVAAAAATATPADATTPSVAVAIPILPVSAAPYASVGVAGVTCRGHSFAVSVAPPSCCSCSSQWCVCCCSATSRRWHRTTAVGR